MDLDILYSIQMWRESIGGCFNALFVLISTIAVDFFLVVPGLIIFWNFNKKKGASILCSYGTSILFGSFLKATICAYRPWIRDSRIKPVADAFRGASGYSFPSGHTTSTSGFYGGLCVAFKKYWWVIVFGSIMVALTMFGRLYLGVHTPQDVIFGLLIGVTSVTVVTLLFKLVDKKKNADIVIYVCACLLIVGLLIYISLKNYPMDYDEYGHLIVDPKKMTVDGFKDPGVFFGILTGWFIERRFINFNNDGTKAQKIARAVIGGALYVIWETVLVGPLGKAVDNGVMHFFLKMSTPALFMTVYPIIFKKIESNGFLAKTKTTSKSN